jgi:ABC-type transport system involved in cytochrome c biogenesis permease subunit
VTTECAVIIAVSLVLYLTASLFFQGQIFLGRRSWMEFGRKTLRAGLCVHAVGLSIHFAVSRTSPFTDMLLVISLFVVALVLADEMVERFTRFPSLGFIVAPLAFFGLLYAVLMPIRFEEAEWILLRYPWLGVHVGTTLLGIVGFTLSFTAAVIVMVQSRLLKRGRLNPWLPALDTAANATDRFAAGGFFVFTIGLMMGVIWLFGAPGEYLGSGDPKIVLTLPTWAVFAAYLYLRGVTGNHGSRLKWLVIAGFFLALVNLLAVRHDFGEVSRVAKPTEADKLARHSGGPRRT